MKKSLILLAALAFAATSPSFAQTAPAAAVATAPHGHGQHPQKTPAQSADHHTAMLTKKLGLTAEQQGKVHAIYLAQAQEAQAAKAQYATPGQRKALHQDMKASHDKYQAQLQGVLTPDQYSKLLAMKQDHKGKGGHGGGKVKTKS